MEPVKPRGRRRPMAEINVVPYIDVMLVLLVIFMITAPMLNLGVEVELPKADAEPMDIEESNEPLVITVLANGDLYLNAGGDLDGTSSGLIDPETLTTTVGAIVRRNPEIQVLVGGDDVMKMDAEQLRQVRRSTMSMVFQVSLGSWTILAPGCFPRNASASKPTM